MLFISWPPPRESVDRSLGLLSIRSRMPAVMPMRRACPAVKDLSLAPKLASGGEQDMGGLLRRSVLARRRLMPFVAEARGAPSGFGIAEPGMEATEETRLADPRLLPNEERRSPRFRAWRAERSFDVSISWLVSESDSVLLGGWFSLFTAGLGICDGDGAMDPGEGISEPDGCRGWGDREC